MGWDLKILNRMLDAYEKSDRDAAALMRLVYGAYCLGADIPVKGTEVKRQWRKEAERNFEVTYENGSKHYLPARDLVGAALLSDQLVLSALPSSFNRDNFVRIMAVRDLDYADKSDPIMEDINRKLSEWYDED